MGTQDGRSTFPPSGVLAVVEAVIGFGIVLLVARWAGRLSWVGVGQVALLVVGAAVIVRAVLETGLPSRLRGWAAHKARHTMEASDASGSGDPELYWFVPFAVVLAVVAALLAVLAILELGDMTWSEFWPWLLAGLAAVFLVMALMAVSYAPPGPNWIHRIAGIDGSTVLIMAGTATLLSGTYQFFTYDAGQASSPLWLGLVAAGLVMGLLGISRSRSAQRKEPSGVLLAEAANRAANRARGASVRAERNRVEIVDELGQADPVSLEASRAAAASAERAARARSAAEQAAEAEAELRDRIDRANREAAEAADLARIVRDAAKAVRPPNESEEPS